MNLRWPDRVLALLTSIKPFNQFRAESRSTCALARRGPFSLTLCQQPADRTRSLGVIVQAL